MKSKKVQLILSIVLMGALNIYCADDTKPNYKEIIQNLREQAKADLGVAIALSELNRQIISPDYIPLYRAHIVILLRKNHLVDESGKMHPEVREVLLKK